MSSDDILAKSETGVYAPEDFITGGKEIVTDTVTLATTGGVVAARSVLGLITASGKAILSATAAGDGSDVAKMILVHEVDTTAGDVVAPVYMEGCFNPDLLEYGTGHSEATAKPQLNERNIYLNTPG